MKYRKGINITGSNLWEPALLGRFLLSGGDVKFYYKNDGKLCYFSDREDDPCGPFFLCDSRDVPLPGHWVTVKKENNTWLLFNESLALDANSNRLVCPVPDSVLDEYLALKKPEKHLVDSSFCFDDYCISHKGQTGFLCQKDGKTVWTFQARAYLYTEIMRYKDHLYFGTAGNGGYFYLIELSTGVPLAQIKTGGTTCIEVLGNKCYILQRDQITNLICVDMDTGEITDSVPLPGKASADSRLQIIDGKVHAITFVYKNRSLHHAVWNIIDL